MKADLPTGRFRSGSASRALFPVLAGALTLALSGCDNGDVVRSGARCRLSTVYPFAKAVAEELARSDSTLKSPIIESTGTGAGMKLFCAGVGPQFPDIEDASRRMKKSEFDECARNGVRDIVEIEVGLDGVAFARSQAGGDLPLTPERVYRALAKNPYGHPNTARTWHDVDPAMPSIPILVYGPPSTSGPATRSRN
jgi:phosphate transport system substrate-binding protein